jgi:hypothetical protein
MKRTAILLLATAGSLFAIVNCSDDGETTTTTTTSTSTTTSSSSGSGGGGNPERPDLSQQIVERMGRPAINTALNAPFEGDQAKKDMAKDNWNRAAPADWATTFQPEVEKNLAILDSLDTVCGNQILAGPNAAAGRYAGLGGALVDDRLWVKLDADNCTTYLAVEADATKVMPNMDCGGRKLSYDVIDISYSVLATGMPQGVTDGIDKPANVDGATFPYLADPNM